MSYFKQIPGRYGMVPEIDATVFLKHPFFLQMISLLTVDSRAV